MCLNIHVKMDCCYHDEWRYLKYSEREILSQHTIVTKHPNQTKHTQDKGVCTYTDIHTSSKHFVHLRVGSPACLPCLLFLSNQKKDPERQRYAIPKQPNTVPSEGVIISYILSSVISFSTRLQAKGSTSLLPRPPKERPPSRPPSRPP